MVLSAWQSSLARARARNINNGIDKFWKHYIYGTLEHIYSQRIASFDQSIWTIT